MHTFQYVCIYLTANPARNFILQSKALLLKIGERPLAYQDRQKDQRSNGQADENDS